MVDKSPRSIPRATQIEVWRIRQLLEFATVEKDRKQLQSWANGLLDGDVLWVNAQRLQEIRDAVGI